MSQRPWLLHLCQLYFYIEVATLVIQLQGYIRTHKCVLVEVCTTRNEVTQSLIPTLMSLHNMCQ